MTITLKNPSALIQAVLNLDTHLSELQRLGNKIEEIEPKSNFDYEHIQKLMVRFAEYGQNISEDVALLADAIKQAQIKAEAMAKQVEIKASVVQSRNSTHEEKMLEFHQLGEQVKELIQSLSDLQIVDGQEITKEQRERINERLPELQQKLIPLIEKAKSLRKEGQVEKIKPLEQAADSLAQSLASISAKLTSYTATYLQ